MLGGDNASFLSRAENHSHVECLLFSQQTIRELFDVNDAEKREVAVELSVPQAEEEEGGNKQSTTILEQVRYMTWDIHLVKHLCCVFSTVYILVTTVCAQV